MSEGTEPAVARGALTHWLLGFVVGGVAGIAPLALGALGVALALPVVFWALIDRPRAVALAGALVGLGATWFIVWGRVMQTCVGPNTATDGCIGPDLGGLLPVPVILLAVGGLISFVTAMRLPREARPPSEEKAVRRAVRVPREGVAPTPDSDRASAHWSP